MTMTTEQQAREEMVRLGASFFQRGYATGSAGNLSLLLADGTLLATPTGSCLGELQAERLSKVSLNGEWLSGDKPSKEISFHRALYLNNPECKAVVHLHCTYLTALSCLQGLDVENAIKPFTPYVVMRVGKVPVVPYYRPGDLRLAEDLAKLAPTHRAFLLANHGPVVTGKDLRAAADNTEEMEDAARLIFTLGDRPIRYLTDDEITELRRCRFRVQSKSLPDVRVKCDSAEKTIGKCPKCKNVPDCCVLPTGIRHRCTLPFAGPHRPECRDLEQH